MIRAVLDANIFISAVLRPEGPPGRILESFLRDGGFRLILTADIVEEVERALRYPKIRKRLAGEQAVEGLLVDLLLLSELVEDGPSPGVCRDPDDDTYLAAAAEGRADFLVTGDADLLTIGHHGGTQIVTAREFLRAIEAR